MQSQFPHLRAATHLMSADLIIVFGNPDIPDDLAYTAASLWHDNMGQGIAITGGVPTAKTSLPEAAYIKSRLIDLGVPEHAITTESNSTNTLENVRFLSDQLAGEGRLDSVQSIIGVGHAIAGQRFLMTLAANWPDADDKVLMHIPVAPQCATLREAFRHADFRADAGREAVKFEPYIARGHIKPIDIDHLNARIAATLSARAEFVATCAAAGNQLPEAEQSRLLAQYLTDDTTPYRPFVDCALRQA